jgi:uncharacterized Zn finger protein (UPF0148 family)
MKAEVLKVNFKQPENPLENMDRRFCLNCESDSFKLSADGQIFCSCCRYRMRNIVVVEK